ncbi:DUF3108 domain-containing protein [Variovorax fucosicus]|uniref:DUF3108 domain-containing protein n=2 Tax=Variovorax fucosicus TaxID=3053517 RepID=UPI002577DFD6|nr:DUF3108 domain-containing protein [Variovorax sp. J22G21]
MTTMPRTADAAPPLAGAARPAWRVLALLTVLVVAVHLVVLGLMPAGIGSEQLPLASKFITRTIVIAPPPAAAEAPAPAAAPPPPVRVARPAPPKRPRAITPPRVDPAPPAATPPVLTAETSQDPIPAEPAAEAPASAASGPDGVAAAPAPDAAGPAGGSNPAMATLTAGATQPLVVPGSVRLAFDVTGQRGPQPMSGVFGELIWLQNGAEYNARLSLTMLFRTFLRQTSTGRVDGSGIAPTRFSEARKAEVASHLVRDQGKVVFSNNAPTVPLLPGAQDRLSVVMQLGALMAGDPKRFPEGSKIEVQTVGPRDADVWVFNVEGEEPMHVPAGDFTVRKLTRSPRREFDHKLELWLAPEIGYLPVRIRQTQTDGDIIDMQLRDKTAPPVAN